MEMSFAPEDFFWGGQIGVHRKIIQEKLIFLHYPISMVFCQMQKYTFSLFKNCFY